MPKRSREILADCKKTRSLTQPPYISQGKIDASLKKIPAGYWLLLESIGKSQITARWDKYIKRFAILLLLDKSNQ